jgi:hypothetical protein
MGKKLLLECMRARLRASEVSTMQYLRYMDWMDLDTMKLNMDWIWIWLRWSGHYLDISHLDLDYDPVPG